MANSIAAQLEVIKSFVHVDSQPLKRPFTRPSLLFDPKEAADIDIETIWSIGIQGLEVLISSDERFQKFKDELFSHRSKELDRELMGMEENNQINVSISSYLRVLSGFFLLPSALKTLEYLIRRYKVHVYNTEDIILCALPYHDTHAFVRILQILDTRNTKWAFLDGVKVSGAPPPRSVIVQQCICDKGILDVLCDYASPRKKFQPSKHVISFCTAVFFEVLGTSLTVNDDIIKRILPFVVSGLHPGVKGALDHRAASFMIIGLLVKKAALAPKLLNSLMRSVAEVACEAAKGSTELQWFRLSLIVLINLVQSQKIDILPKKATEVLKEIRNLAGTLLELSKEFNVDNFLLVLLDSLIDLSWSDDCSQQALISILEKVPIQNYVHHVVTKILSSCVKLTQKVSNLKFSMPGGWVKKILIVFNKRYPSELRRAVNQFLQDNKVRSKKDGSVYKILCKILDGNLDSSLNMSDSKIWLALHHPKSLVDIQEALLRQLNDKDLTVVRAALSVNGLPDVIGSPELFDALQKVLRRCIDKLLLGSAENVSLTSDVAISCLKIAISYCHGHTDHMKRTAAMIFPLLLALPQTQSLNLKAMRLVNEINWPLYQTLAVAPDGELTVSGSLSSINLKTINIMAENFRIYPEDHITWFVENCSDLELSKTLFFLMLFQALVLKPSSDDFPAIFENVFPMLKAEWESLVSAGDFMLEEFNSEILDWDCSSILKFLDTDLKSLNAKLIVCIFWKLVAALMLAMPSDILRDDNDKWVSWTKDLFVCFAASKFKHAFHEHLRYLVAQCKISPPCLLSKFFTEEGVPVEVQVESLRCFAFLCSLSLERCQFELLAEFPSVLVPLASDNQDTRIAAMNCIDGLCVLWSHLERSGRRNGSNATWSHFLGELLGLIDQQKTLILSDERFLPSMFASMLGSTCHNILVPQNIENRFDQPTREKILGFILGSALKLSNYGKLKILSLLKGIGKGIVCVKEVVSLLSLLLHRRNQCFNVLDEFSQKLSSIEIEMLCLLLESCVMSSSSGGNDFEGHLLTALRLDSTSSGHPAYVQPCLTILRKLSRQFYGGLKNEVKEHLFHELLFLCCNANGEVQSSAREAILRIDISFSTFGDMLDIILERGSCINISESKKKKKLSVHAGDNIFRREKSFYILSSLLDVLLLKKDITKRHMLISPLFKLLSRILSEEWLNDALFQEKGLTQPSLSEANRNAICHVQQTLLIILEDIITSLGSTAPLKENITNEINFNVLIVCAHSSKDVVTRNHVFSLLSAVAKAFPEEVFGHILDIVAVVGESTITQIDGHSKHVFEDLISAIVPCWLSKTDDVKALLKIFMDTLPEVVEHRRLSTVLYLLRTLGEDKSFASLLVLLFHSLVSREQTTLLNIKALDALTFYTREWEYKLAVQICEQYTSPTWVPALVMLLQQLGNEPLELFLAMQFTLHKLQDPEFLFKMESGEDADIIQKGLGELMEQIVFLLQHVLSKKKQLKFPVLLRKELKEALRAAGRNITLAMRPSAYFSSIIKLLRHEDKDVAEMALGLLCETARNHKVVSSKSKENKTRCSNPSFPWLNMNESDQKSFDKMCLEIVRVLDDPAEGSSTSMKVAAVSALEVLANSFPSNNLIFVLCLRSIARCISWCNLVVASSCLRTTAALVNVVGPKALAELPHLMENMMRVSSELFSNSDTKPQSMEPVSPVSKDLYLLSVLITLEVVVDKLGGFLNPYLSSIIDLLVLHPEYVSGRDTKLQSRASGLRKLLAERIPVRLALPPLLNVYPASLNAGDKSLEIMFDMLATLVGTMDRPSIVAFHGKIFDLCLLALDIRHQSPVSVHNVDAVERSVINAMIALTMKLTESMFKPLFIKSIEWAESDVGEAASVGSTDRAISFYGMVNKLAESHRSLFVPYFKHLLGSCVHHLGNAGDVKLLSRKNKKAKTQDDDSTKGSIVSIKSWHLRKLVLSCLHKCFLYDTGSTKFLDSSNFQMLLKPIVSQLVIEPPASLDDTPSVQEVDDLLVVCIGQMAVTAGNDLLWKPLNHEVLMQTRSEKLRARMLGLRIVKYLVENLKEEYLVFLAETIPFLGELLEDVEPCVKSLAQEILKEMESMSGESLRQYL
ncbi:uncharacterized protein At3g06530 isoform X2 [Neltuma alba]|uniref:uncharacterized protein At3g06530 isoform X2 n=1 Tax=Neltuma alba TaxID=207710 RepID=UPI0010A44297|nr:uncharacterized protein At3g06530 isoform X2 [Prosopis alba]